MKGTSYFPSQKYADFIGDGPPSGLRISRENGLTAVYSCDNQFADAHGDYFRPKFRLL